MIITDEAIAELALVSLRGRQYAAAQTERDTALQTLRNQIRTANDHIPGLSRQDLIAASGLARQTVYDALAAR